MPRFGKAKTLTSSEFKRTIAVQNTSKHATRNIALLYVSFGLGLRSKELAQLSIADVCNPDRTLKDVINLTPHHTKGRKQRHIYLTNKKVIVALSNYLSERPNDSISAPLFLSQKDGRFTPNTMQMLFKRMYLAAGIPDASSHSGRRTFATNLIENGSDIKAVSKLMGHSSIAMTAEYVADNPERLKVLSQNAI